MRVQLLSDGSPPPALTVRQYAIRSHCRQLIHLPTPVKPLRLRFVIAPGAAAAENAVLRTNYPLQETKADSSAIQAPGAPFERHTFYSAP